MVTSSRPVFYRKPQQRKIHYWTKSGKVGKDLEEIDKTNSNETSKWPL